MCVRTTTHVSTNEQIDVRRAGKTACFHFKQISLNAVKYGIWCAGRSTKAKCVRMV